MTDYSPASFASSLRALWSEGAAISAAHIEASEHRRRAGSDGQNVAEDYLKAGLSWHSVTYVSVSMTAVTNISTFPKVRGIIGFPEMLEAPLKAEKPAFCENDNRHEWLLNAVGTEPDLTSLHLTIIS